MESKYITERDQLCNDMVANTFYRNWNKNPDDPTYNGNFDNFEFILTADCTNNCKYCYMQRYPGLFDEHPQPEVLLKNTKRCMEFLSRNNYSANIDIFTGDFFYIPLWRDILEVIYAELSKMHPDRRARSISIPTNMWWITDDKILNDTKEYQKRFKDIGVFIALSASVDGKYCESNRPSTIGLVKDDSYYDKLFTLSKEMTFGFHPMVYSHNIEHWPRNFDWFIAMLSKYNIPDRALYLLEVRNAEWNDSQLQHYYYFVQHILKYMYTKSKGNLDDFVSEISHTFNMLSCFVSSIGRGLGCSVQSEFAIRIADLKYVLCHRTMYDIFQVGDFNPETGLLSNTNPELLIAMTSFQASKTSYCQHCMIKTMCSFYCLGSAYEVVGSLFEPIPSVCRLYHTRALAFIDFLETNNIPLTLFDPCKQGFTGEALSYIRRTIGGKYE